MISINSSAQVLIKENRISTIVDVPVLLGLVFDTNITAYYQQNRYVRFAIYNGIFTLTSTFERRIYAFFLFTLTSTFERRIYAFFQTNLALFIFSHFVLL